MAALGVLDGTDCGGDLADGIGVPVVLLWTCGEGLLCAPVPPNLPIFFSHPMSSGSFPPAQSTSISPIPLSALVLAHTAANAPPIWVKGTTAVPLLGFLGGAGLSETRIEDASMGPKGERSGTRLVGVVRVGCEERLYLTRTVVSSVPV